MAEVLWAQQTGVDYSAAEDRRLISSIWNPGVIYGLKVSAGTGLSAKVSAGRCVISDGAGGCYLAYFDASTTVSSLTASATNTLYVTVDPTTAQATIVRSAAAPTVPYAQIGSATTSSSAVTSVSNSRPVASSPFDAGVMETYGVMTATTGADGSVTVNHNLGVVPTLGAVWANNSAHHVAVALSSMTSSQMTVFVRKLSDATLVTATSVQIAWLAKS